MWSKASAASSAGNFHGTCGRTPKRLRARADCDAAACLLLERDAHLVGGKIEDVRDVVADLDRERLAENAFVPKTVQVELERFRLEAARTWPVFDLRDV